MKTVEILEKAQQKIDTAIQLLKEANKNESLESHYGYTIKLMIQELVKVSDNHVGYLTRDKSISDLIETEGDNWDEKKHHVYEHDFE